MQLILAGCEYSGTTTLAHAIDDWLAANMGARFSLIHDHWKIPHTSGHPDDTTPEEQAWLLEATPKIKEMHQRHSLYYHVQPGSFTANDHMMIGAHIEDAVYGPMYFGYGQKGSAHDRELVAHQVERTILRFTNDTVLVHVETDTDVIEKRMQDDPHEHQVIGKNDIEAVKTRFSDLVAWSLLGHKITINNSGTMEETMAEFARKIEPHLTDTDRTRILAHGVLVGGQGRN